jgi:signal transduction histidine kinase
MKQISVENLKARIRGTTWLPLGIISTLFLCAMAFVLQRQHQIQLSNTRQALSDIIRSQETQIAQEIYLGQIDGLRLRLISILDSWKSKYPGTEACLEFKVSPPSGSLVLFGGCATGVATADVLTPSIPFEEYEVLAGGKVLAELHYAVVRYTGFFDLFPPLMIGALFVSLIAAVLSHSLLVKRIEGSVLRPLLEKITQDERNTAIADTTRMLAHDIRKPFHLLQLAAVRLSQDKIQRVKELGVSLNTEVQRNIKSVDSMIRDILDVSRDLRPSLENISVGLIVERLKRDIDALFPESKDRITFSFRRRHRVTADPEQINRVLINLVENAVYAVDGKGSISLSVEETSLGTIQFALLNNGPVIPSDDLAKIFSPFFTSRKNGTGLGLAIAKKVIELHAGTIDCVSSEAGGTRFSFTLPATTALAPNKAALKQSRLAALQVLVFDDEEAVRTHWMDVLKNHDFQAVLAFKSWEDFIAQDGFSQLNVPTVAFVDIHFKGSTFDGMDIAKSLKQLGVERLYAITADMEKAVDSGLFDVVLGKVAPKDLLKKLI